MSVGECGSPEDIARMFKDRFTVSSPLGPSWKMIDVETSRDYKLIRYSVKHVAELIKRMAMGKSPGHEGLIAGHLKSASAAFLMLTLDIYT